MMRSLRTRPRMLLVVVLALSQAGAQERPLPSSFVPGVVIIKFSQGSKAGEILAQATQGDPSTDTRLIPYLSTLSTQLGVPLKVKRLTSGGELIVSIQHRELTARLVDLLNRSSQVLRTWECNGSKKDGCRPTGNKVFVEYEKSSQEAQFIAKALAEGKDASASLAELTKKLERKLGFSLIPRVIKKQQLILEVDMSALTLDVAERLSKRADVEYAQPNFVFRISGGLPLG